MHWKLAKGLAMAVLAHSSAALPAADKSRSEVVQTTQLDNGLIVDWINPELQGKLASPPPLPPNVKALRNAKSPSVEAATPQARHLRGPKGTIPIARTRDIAKPNKRLPAESDNKSGTKNDSFQAADTNAGKHWYSSTAQVVANHGGKAIINLWKSFVQSSTDFSLLQTAVIRYNVPVSDGTTTLQTVEAGWINYQAQGLEPHLFSFYTTNGYNGAGDGIGGWNREQSGWVQVDDQLYPGVPFSTLSEDGGTQYEITIRYDLHEGNWWLFVLDRYIGYYPASLFTKGVDASATLESQSSQINWYGEIYNSEDALTTTDMGSGNFADAGIGHAAYIRNIEYTDTNGQAQPYDGSAETVVSDESRYSIKTFFNSGTNYGSYFLLGGPGAGGVVNG